MVCIAPAGAFNGGAYEVARNTTVALLESQQQQGLLGKA